MQSRFRRPRWVDPTLIAAATLAASACSALGQATSLPSFNVSNIFNVTVANSGINGGVPASTSSSASVNATAINNYISHVSALSGGGTVEIPAGAFNSNTITMRSNVNLLLDSGATLTDATPANTLIQSTGTSSNMEISGSGIINGAATTTVGSNKLVSLNSVSTLEITGVSIENAANEHLGVEGDSNVTINNITIADPDTLAANMGNYLGNTDGLDYWGSNFTIENSSFNDGDDDIVAKTASGACSNILITNDTIGAGHGISVGGGTKFGLRNMTVTNITFNGTNPALRLKAEDATTDAGGGTAAPVVNVLYSNIVMNNVSNPLLIDSFYNGGNNFPTSPTQTNQAVDTTTPMWENVGFSNITVNTTSNGGLFYDLNTTPSNLQGLSFNNVTINSGSAMKLWWGTNINLSGLTTNQTVDQEDLTNVTQSGPASITWNNTGAAIAGTSLGDGATWDITANQNWNTGTSFTTYTNSSNVTFNDTNNGHYAVTLNVAVSPLSVTINNSSGAYTISGSGIIAGSGSLTKSGTNTATISTSNAYTGGTIINGGTLKIGTVNALGATGTLGTATSPKPGGTTINTTGSLDLNGLSLVEPITLSGGTLTNTSNTTASVVSGVKGVGYTTSTPGISGNATITFNSGTAAATPVFGITAASFTGFTGTYPTPIGTSAPQPQVPNVLITSSDGKGSGALASAILSGNGVLTGITIVNPGSGYDAPPIISFIGGTATTPGTATGNANNFTLVGIQMTSPGSGYTSAPTATLSNNTGPGAVTFTPVAGSLALSSTSTVGGSAGNITLAVPITGPGPAAKVGLIKTGSDTVTIAAAATYAGADTQINQGTLAIDLGGSFSSSPLDVNTGAKLNFIDQTAGTAPLARNVAGINLNGGNAVVALAPSPQSTNRSVIVTPSLTDTTGTLDLTNNDMILKGVGSAGLTTITQQITQGRNNGSSVWSGSAGGVTSSSAAATPNTTALAIELNNDGADNTLLSTFDGQTVTNTDVLVKYTFVGDADLSGTITATDYTLIDNGFNNDLTGWRHGDFNYDGVINGDDYTLIDNAFNTQGSVTYAADSAGPTEMIASQTEQIATPQVPEPTSFCLMGFGITTLLRRRRRRLR